MIFYRFPQEEMFITTTLNVRGEYISSLMAPNVRVPEFEKCLKDCFSSHMFHVAPARAVPRLCNIVMLWARGSCVGVLRPLLSPGNSALHLYALLNSLDIRNRFKQQSMSMKYESNTCKNSNIVMQDGTKKLIRNFKQLFL